ncbi:hypothetical protein BDF14DRAFT_1718940 [Spinellus fusiger]|nr:hypothetical protein BDF14DRAFT_1718940 [Spinellus fusiger]
MFQRHWAKGQPIVISNTMANSQLTWSPDYFIEHYDQEEIEVIDCTTGKTSLSTVRAYFDSFKSYGQQLRNKNKNAAGKTYAQDWPPKQDFSTHSPALYKDFMEMLSVKDYCTANGYMNLANRLPKEYVPSDLGPKMFIAYGSTQGVQGTGTTNLHCDMADAVNVMCYADITDEHASAIWDIYAYKDMAKIETFLVKIAAERKRNIISPIHNQWLYLNDELRQRLYKEYGIKSWRILQNPGDAVYIPAGCAHQVSNYHSAIKCAYDFVSPENVDRCARITRQFSSIKHSDTLQLKNILLFAWKKVYNDWKFLSEKKVIKADYMKEEEEPAVLL